MAQREQDILRVDARDKVTGRTKYAADLAFDGILYTKSVHADLPHGKLLAVHTAAALAAEGVAGVYTARDIPGRNVGDNEKPIMVYDTIRSRGDCIAVVAAVSQEAADRAARLVTYDAQPMPAVFDPEEALLPDAPKLYDDGNLILEHRVRKGRAAQGFDEADIIVEREFRTQRVIPGAIEPESVVVSPQDGELRVYCPCKAPFNIRRIVAAACGLPMSAVRVTQPGMGGSFGGKDDDAGAMAARAAIAALHTGRPCRMTWRSSETLLEGVKRHPFHIYYKAGAKRDGTLTAIEVRGFVDGGAYLSKSKTTTWRSGIEATGPYRVEHVDVCMKAAYTNNCYAGSVRGFGSPQIDFATESVMDELAQQLGMTPWAFREKNLLRDGDISGSGQPMRDVSAGACLERLRREFGEDLRPFVRNGKLVGRGIACLYRGESYGAGTPVQDTSGVTIVLNADGSLNVSTGLSEVGQGGHTLLTAIIGRELGLPPERIHIAPADTDYCVDSGSTAASRGTITAGNAAWLAAQEAKQQINTALWEYRGFDGPIVYEDGLVRCGDEQMTFTEAVGVLRNTGRDMRAHGWWAAPKTFWDREKCRGSNYMSYAYGACGAEVEIDPITGKTDVTDFVAVHDIGRIINHAATVGQVGGGVSMGVGYALTENADTPGGVTRAADLDSYLLPTALDMCPVRTVLLEEGAGVPPLLVHGIGEPATSIVAPAITNAMSAALGARIDTLPADLETVRAILDEKKEVAMFLQAGSPAELRAYMAQYPDSRCIAGGTDIMPVQNRENDHEAVFIDISGAAALHRIVSEDGVLSVGAAATFAEIERNALLRQYAPVLCLAAAQVGSPQIRNLGTIGGNVAHGSPAADTLPVLAMLDAEVRLYSATEGTCRDIPVDTFITGPGQTLLRPGEYIEALRFSPPEASWRMAYEKVGRRNALAISRLSACCAARWEGQRLTGLRLALGAVFPTPRRLYAAEALLLREQPSPAAEMQAAELVTQAIVAAAGRRASASYKLAVAPELLLRTLRRTREEADQ